MGYSAKEIANYEQVKKDIQNGIYKNFYLFSGPENYFIDELCNLLINCVVDEAAEGFDQLVLDGNETKIRDIIESARLYPVLGEYRLIVIKNAQKIRSDLDNLTKYLKFPNKNSIIAYCHSEKTVDKRTKLYNIAKKEGVFLEFTSLYDYQAEQWIQKMADAMKLKIHASHPRIIREYNGNSLIKIKSILDKLKLVVDDKAVTSEIIHQYIGVSKDFNNFELQDAIGKRDAEKAILIAKHLCNTQNSNPLVVTLSTLHGFFLKLLTYHCLPEKQDASKTLGIHSYFLRDYRVAADNFSPMQTKLALNEIFQADLKLKGITAHRSSPFSILNELILRILIN